MYGSKNSEGILLPKNSHCQDIHFANFTVELRNHKILFCYLETFQGLTCFFRKQCLSLSSAMKG